MLRFFYDSLDTLKKVKKPTIKETREFTIQVFIAVLIGSILFFILDNFRGNVYKQIYQTFGGSTVQVAPVDVPSSLPIPGTPPTSPEATPPTEDTQTPPEEGIGEVVAPVPTEPTPEAPAA